MERLNRTRLWLADQWSPCCMIIAADEANSLCHAANGLSVVGLLRPFGVLAQLNGNIGVPVRTVGEAPFRLHSWRLRFYEGSAMFQPTPEAADARLKSVLGAAVAAAGEGDVPTLQELLSPDSGEPTPWYTAYRDEFLRLMAFGDHEAVDHPVACVLVLPTTVQGDLAAAFEALYARPGALPPLMQQGVMEARIPRHYVLLHDARAAPLGTLERAQQQLRQLGASVVAQCHLLVINSRTPEQPPGMNGRFWSAAAAGAVGGGGAGEPATYPPPPPGVAALGSALSERDVQGLAEFVRGLAVQHIIPSLEARIRALNHQVTSTRKGLRNQLKSLLWRKSSSASSFLGGGSSAADSSPAGTAPSTPSATSAGGAGGAPLPSAYLHSSVEGEMRALSDLALMLRDTETAIGTLRLLASDFKQDKAWKHYAAVQEALGAATILSNGSAADAVASYKEAFYRYQQVAQLGGRHRVDGTRYATRVAMQLAEFLRAIGQHGEANYIFMKAHFQEENLRAGLLLEQAAHSLLRLAPSPHTRKFAFHLVLAGLRYNLCGQKELALRAYKQVLGVYEGRQWALIEEHLHDVLGKQCREAGDWLGAVQHYGAMVLCPANSPHCQRAYLAQFLDVLRAAADNLGFTPSLELPVPVVELERVGLQYDSQAGYANPEARQVKGDAWRQLEAAVQPAAEGGPVTWLDGGSRASMAGQQAEHTCVVGEAVGVEVELSNPLQVELAVTRLRLGCSFEPAGGAGAQPAGSSAAAPAAAVASSGPSIGEKPRPAGLQIREESLTLAPGERMTVQLRVVPLKAGALSVEGVHWLLNGVAPGQQRFRIPRPKPRKPGSSKPLLDAERPPPGGVSFRVLPPQPHLEVTAPPLPPTLAAGELLRCPLRLRNTGAMTMHAITLAVGAPGILLTAAEVAAPQPAPAAPGSSTSALRTGSPGGGSSQGDEASSSAAGDSLLQQTDGGIDLSSSSMTAPAAADGASPQAEAAQAALLAAGSAAAQGRPPRAPQQQLHGDGALVQVLASERQGVTVFTVQPPGGGKLGVGQELHLLLWLRPTQPGLARFSCVWYYEPVVRLDSLRFRTLRAAYSTACLPSLDLRAALAGGRPVPGAGLLQLRAANQQGVDAFRLTHLACPGGAWQLAGLQEPAGGQQRGAQHGLASSSSSSSVGADPGTSSLELGVLVGPESAATLHYRLTPVPGLPPPAPPSYTEPPPNGLCGSALGEAVEGWMFLRSHPRRRPRLPVAPSSASLASAASRAGQEAAAAGEEAGRDPSSGELSAPVDLVVQWEVAAAASGAPRTGFHVLYQQRVQGGPPVHAQLVGPGSVGHDFAASPFCTLHLLLRVRNTLLAPATVRIEAGTQADGRPTVPGMPTWTAMPEAGAGSTQRSGGWVQPVGQHVWCGRTRITLPDLPGGCALEVPLQVAVAQPGSFSLSDYTITWSYAHAPELSGSQQGPACFVAVQQQQRERQQRPENVG